MPSSPRDLAVTVDEARVGERTRLRNVVRAASGRRRRRRGTRPACRSCVAARWKIGNSVAARPAPRRPHVHDDRVPAQRRRCALSNGLGPPARSCSPGVQRRQRRPARRRAAPRLRRAWRRRRLLRRRTAGLRAAPTTTTREPRRRCRDGAQLAQSSQCSALIRIQSDAGSTAPVSDGATTPGSVPPPCPAVPTCASPGQLRATPSSQQQPSMADPTSVAVWAAPFPSATHIDARRGVHA